MKKIASACYIFLLIAFLTGCTETSNKEQDRIVKMEKMDEVEKLMAQEFFMTRDPQLNIIPKERLITAMQYMQSLQSASRIAALTWEERGPSNIGGRTRAILVDKANANGDIVFAASVAGGVFRSTNFTSANPTWTVINDFLPNLAITCMIQDPVSLNVMYAGTGEGWFNVDAIRGRGIYKSTDGGTSWTVLPSTIVTTPADSTFEYVQDLVIDNNGALYASLRNLTGFSRGVKRSTDGGGSWTQVLGAPLPGFATGRAADLEVASNGDVYASLGMVGAAVTNRAVVMKSSFAVNGPNTGAVGTWVDITPVRGRASQRTEIILAPSDPLRVYLLMQDSATHQVIGTYRSFNGGQSWDSTASAPALNGGAPQTWYNLIGAVDPNNADIIVVGGLNQAKSTDAGVTWSTITAGVHVDHHFQQFIGSSKLVNGNDGGVYYSSNIDAASPTFANKNSGYNVTQFYACDYHPTNLNYFLAGAQDNGTQKFVSPGMNATTQATGGDGGFCHIDQTDGQIQITGFIGSQYGISTNGGASFTTRSFNPGLGQFINPTDYDDNQNLFFGGGGANSYTVINNLVPASSATLTTSSVPTMGGRSLTAVKVDPSTANTIWVGASSTGGLPQVLKISNATASTPTVVASATLGSITGATVACVEVDPANSNHVVATLSNFGVVSVWESTNGGVSYTAIEGNLPDMPVRWALFAPSNAQLNGPTGGNGGLLIGTELGVWTTSAINGASTQWIPNNTGLANVSTHMLKLRASDNLVVAATHGRGLFTTIIPTVPTGLPNDPVTKNFIRYTFNDNAKLQISIGNLQTKTMTVQLVDMKGSLVYRSENKYANLSIPIDMLQRGSYIVTIRGNNNEYFVKQFVK